MHTTNALSFTRFAKKLDFDPRWHEPLPAHWRDMVRVALDFVERREYEMAASRCFGHDVDGVVCYYAHGYVLNATRAVDDEDDYQVVAYSEAVNAWRLRDERWLIHRIIHPCGKGAPGRGCYSFAELCRHCDYHDE